MRRTVAGLAFAVATAGCAGTGPDPVAESSARVAGEIVFDARMEPSEPMRGADFWPAGGGEEVVYRSVEGKPAEHDEAVGGAEEAPTGAASRSWRIERSESTDGGAPEWEERRFKNDELVRIDRLRWTASGEIVLTETVNKDRGLISRYEPALVIAPGRIRPGQRLTQEAHVTVHPESDPERINQRGDATNTIEYVGDQRLRTPAGSFRAARLESTFEGSFGISNVTSTTTSWLVESVGLAAERYEERVKALLPISQRSHWFVIVKRSQEPGS